ncbi:MAG: hypothetical protein L3J78_00640 [Thermoplasmata archaeon]|nr:hypothetical protein [Thermoplasmata archaeon]
MPKERKASSVGPEIDLSAFGAAEARSFLSEHLDPDPKSGILRFASQPAVLVRPAVIVNIQKQLEQTIGGSSKGIMYLAGEKSALEGIIAVSPDTPHSQASWTMEHAKRVFDTLAILGWGRTEILAFDPEAHRLVLSVLNSPIATAYGPARKPVCHFIAGWAAGVGQLLLKKDSLCEETSCLSQGHARCEFELRSMHS